MRPDQPADARSKVAGIRLPDSKLALEAAEIVRVSSPRSPSNHAFRTYLFGELLGRRRGLKYDSELLFLGALQRFS